MFWSKGPETKKEKVAANRHRDMVVRAHQLHMKSDNAQSEETSQSTGFSEGQSASEEGIDTDARSQLGRQKQMAKEIIQGKSKQIGKMQARVRHSRMKAKGRGRSMGF